MEKKPLISIIMNCHNGSKYLKKSLSSIINQNYKNWELIFWNNNSSDSSKIILKKFVDKRIRYYESKKVLSLYKARNLAVKKANGKYIAFLDTDDWWVKRKLDTQVNILRSNNKIKFLCSNYYLKFKNKKKIKYQNKSKKINIVTTQNLLNEYRIAILTVLMKKSFFLKKKFNTKYSIIGDFDYFINLSLNEKIYFINSPLAYYRLHDDNFSNKISLYLNEVKYWIKNNSIKLEKKGLKLKSIRIFYLKLIIKKILVFGRVVQWWNATLTS